MADMTVEQVDALTGDDVAYWMGNPFLSADMRVDKVRWWITKAAAPAEALSRVLALVDQLDADLAAAAPAQFSIGLMRGRLKAIREAGESHG